MTIGGWILGTFHTAALGLVLLLIVDPRGGLGTTLANLSTRIGIALFLTLWTTTLFTTSRAVAGLDALADPVARDFYRRALRWGGINGILFSGPSRRSSRCSS